MAEVNDRNDYYYYYRHPLDTDQLKNAVSTITTKMYLSRLIKLQTISTLVLLSAIALQTIAISTNDWFVLNVNEYVQTAKGGLWYYCYLSNAGMVGKLDCSLYEKLPNFFVFANDRLFDSRVLLLCSSGFLFIVMLIEISGIICLCMSEKRGCDPFARVLNQRSRKFEILNENMKRPVRQTSTPTLKGYKNSMLDFEMDENFNKIERSKRPIKPIGYFAFLAISLITMVGSVMEFVLKVSGFALFDNYINRLLSFNRVFMAYRSWSYWLMAGSILFILIFWIFKVIATRYVVSLAKTVVLQDAAFSALAGIVDVVPSGREKSVVNEVARAKYTHKKSRQIADGLIVNQTRPSYQQQSNVIPTYALDIYTDDLETSESNTTITESVLNDILASSRNSQRVVNYPSFPYIYRF
jgi:hypothetical protein